MRCVCRNVLVHVFVLGAWLGLSGCPDDCEVACGKLEYCALLGDASRESCNRTCEEAPSEAASRCADCLDNTGCGAIGSDNCDRACAGTLEIDDP